MTVEEIFDLTWIDPRFPPPDRGHCEGRADYRQICAHDGTSPGGEGDGILRPALAKLWKTTEQEIRERRFRDGVLPVYKLVDTCAAEFEAYTPYYYST